MRGACTTVELADEDTRSASSTARAKKVGRELTWYEQVDVYEALRDMTGGQGPDACIDAVGLEAHGTTLDAWYDRAKTSMYLATDRSHVLREAITACRKGGIVSIPERIERGEIDPSFIITHRVRLDDAPEMYRTFREKHDGCVKVVMRPH